MLILYRVTLFFSPQPLVAAPSPFGGILLAKKFAKNLLTGFEDSAENGY